MISLQDFIIKHFFNLASLEQLIVVSVILAGTWVASRKLSQWLDNRANEWQSQRLSSITSYIHLSMREVLFLLLSPLVMWIAVMIANAANWPVSILNGVASLLSAWAVIRLGSSIIESNFWSQTLALSVWIIAALNILGWLQPVIDVLNKAALPFGKHNLSLLLLLKGSIVIVFFLWLAGLASEGLERVLGRAQIPPSQKVLFLKLAKISLIALAIILGLDVVGIDLTALAVFSGALGIGIGFGLQKVFANLMSGFILLMDKSIKPGDVIAIADTYGWVNRLGARYVSILTRDGKEHLIPNETLITERVENWSYSDDKIRIHIPIGVSYDSDIPLVKQLLLDVVSQHIRILKNPQPTCLIKGFGDSSVNFEIRVWIEDPVNGVSNVRSAIYEDIWVSFKQHGIKIPFPQRDMNLNMQQIHNIIEAIKSE